MPSPLLELVGDRPRVEPATKTKVWLELRRKILNLKILKLDKT